MKLTNNNQQGFSAVVAIILIVFFGLIGTYISSLSTVSAFNTAQSAKTLQAWFAARSGLEWAVYDALQNSASNLNCNSSGPSFTLSGGSTSGFDVQISCTSNSVSEGGATYNVFNLTSSASRNTIGTIAYASRTITASVTDAP